MNELYWQKVTVDVVREFGGFGFKLSNRFLVGIPDLLLQHPDLGGTSLWEVKWRAHGSYKSQDFKLKLTELQKKTLRDYWNAGGSCGVLHFYKGTKDIWMQAIPYKMAERTNWHAPHELHHRLERGKREDIIIECLKWACNENRREQAAASSQS